MKSKKRQSAHAAIDPDKLGRDPCERNHITCSWHIRSQPGDILRGGEKIGWGRVHREGCAARQGKRVTAAREVACLSNQTFGELKWLAPAFGFRTAD